MPLSGDVVSTSLLLPLPLSLLVPFPLPFDDSDDGADGDAAVVDKKEPRASVAPAHPVLQLVEDGLNFL